MEIRYSIQPDLDVDLFIDLLERSTLGERRPIHDRACMAGMVQGGDLTVCAYAGEKLVGLARSVTDFHYCCYLSELAVDREFQQLGIGRQLQIRTQAELGPRCKLILLAAPAASSYYPHIGYEKHDDCWILDRDRDIEAK